MKRPKVTIILKYVTQYRLPFFELLRTRLNGEKIDLVLVFGQPGCEDSLKNDSVQVKWGNQINNKIFKVNKKELFWQPCLPFVRDSDLIIVEQANKLLINYLLILLNQLGIKRMAYWGHGRNFHATETDKVSEWIKHLLVTKVYWWFAYNDLSARLVSDFGFSDKKITSVQNAVDTCHLSQSLLAQQAKSREELKKEVGIISDNVGLYVGGIYNPEKKIEFLLKSCLLIRKQIPDFEMVFIGSGSAAYLVKEFSEKFDWVHYLGSMYGDEKVKYFALAKAFLMPGLVGLAVLDCFALEVPLITTSNKYHSPEIDYLKNGANGIIVDNPDDPQKYASDVVKVLQDDQFRQKLVEGCRTSKSKYTIEEMVERFVEGVKKALEQ